MSSSTKHPETLALHAGWRSDPTTGAVAVPVYQTTSYQFRDTEHAANLFALKELGNIYTRIMNPTNDVLEKRVAAMEGGVGALALASGQAASAFAIAKPRARRRQRGQLDRSLWRNLEFVCQYAEGSGHRSPLCRSDRSRITSAARPTSAPALTMPKRCPTRSSRCFPSPRSPPSAARFGIPLIVDNTAAPILTRPFEHGAAVIVYSTTKYLGGHGNSIGGLIVDGGNFDWAAHPQRQPALNTPDPSYHGAVWTRSGEAAGADRLHHQGPRHAAARPGLGDVAVQRVPDPAGLGDADAAHGKALREYASGDRFPAQAAGDHPRHSSVGADRRAPRAGRTLSQGRAWRSGRLRTRRRQGRRPPLHRRAGDVLSRRQYRRRAQPGDPSRHHHALAA